MNRQRTRARARLGVSTVMPTDNRDDPNLRMGHYIPELGERVEGFL